MRFERNGFSYEKYSELDYVQKMKQFNEIFSFLKKLVFEYPDFEWWYSRLFSAEYEIVPTREIIICKKDTDLAGVIILKKSRQERKICTLRVDRKYRNYGIATQLIKYGLDWLDTDKPLVTCHKMKKGQFDKIFQYFGFELEQEYCGYYSFFNIESVYNGQLPNRANSINLIEIMDISNCVKYAMQNGIYDLGTMANMCIGAWMDREKRLQVQLLRG